MPLVDTRLNYELSDPVLWDGNSSALATNLVLYLDALVMLCTDAAAAVAQLTMEEIRALEAETDVTKVEKRVLTGPDGKPIDLAAFGQVQIDPK